MRHRTWFLILSFLFVVWAETEIRCTVSYCTDYISDTGCDELTTACRAMNSTHYGSFLRYPDVCNCCDYCLTSLAEDAVCVSGLPGMLPPSEICGSELYCTKNDDDDATCQRISTNCTFGQDEFDSKRDNGTLGSTEIRPECDEDGLFSPAHCIPGSLCYCLAPTGERIFGEIPYLDPWDSQKMTCGCSLNAWKAENTLDSNYDIPVMRCLSNGLFDPLQCMMGTNATCLCVNTFTGNPERDVTTVLESELTGKSPSCFDATIHTTGKYYAVCEAEYNTLLAEIEKLEAENATEINIDLPSCQPDGKYARMQTNGSSYICVDPLGVQINSYEALTNSIQAEVMDCNCARTRWLLAKAGVVELPTCCSFGNFESWQCRRKECFCVDENGNQIGREVDLVNLATLSCYKTNNGDACFVS